MREILFRGKHLDTGGWVEGAFCMKDCDNPFGEMVDRPSIIKYDEPCSGFWFRVDPETVGQFIGLTDKNGKKVFEGDIVKINAIGLYKGVVCWDGTDMRFVVKNTVYNHTYTVNNAWYHPDYSVIGNI